ncbi:major capsid protein [bacterium]|nr:major capsid protein [bacterium]
MLPSILTQQFLTGVVRAWPQEGYIGNDILPIVGAPSLKTMWDIIERDDKLAPFVAINAESPLADKAGIQRGFHEMTDIRLKERLDEDELIALREPGQADVVTGLAATRQAGAERYIRRTMDRMTGRVVGRLEWLRWQVLSTGVITYDDNKVKFSVDFGVPAGNKIALTSTDMWSDLTNSDPISDIQEWIETYIATTGRVPTRMYVGTNIPKYLAQNSKIRDLMKYNGVIEKLISTQSVLDYLGTIFNLKIQRYATSYLASNGAATYFLGANSFVLMCEPNQADGEQLGDVASGPAKANNYETGLYSWAKEEEDPWATFVGAGIHAFPRIYHPSWIMCGTVHS